MDLAFSTYSVFIIFIDRYYVPRKNSKLVLIEIWLLI